MSADKHFHLLGQRLVSETTAFDCIRDSVQLWSKSTGRSTRFVLGQEAIGANAPKGATDSRRQQSTVH